MVNALADECAEPVDCGESSGNGLHDYSHAEKIARTCQFTRPSVIAHANDAIASFGRAT